MLSLLSLKISLHYYKVILQAKMMQDFLKIWPKLTEKDEKIQERNVLYTETFDFNRKAKVGNFGEILERCDRMKIK